MCVYRGECTVMFIDTPKPSRRILLPGEMRQVNKGTIHLDWFHVLAGRDKMRGALLRFKL